MMVLLPSGQADARKRERPWYHRGGAVYIISAVESSTAPVTVIWSLLVTVMSRASVIVTREGGIHGNLDRGRAPVAGIAHGSDPTEFVPSASFRSRAVNVPAPSSAFTPGSRPGADGRRRPRSCLTPPLTVTSRAFITLFDDGDVISDLPAACCQGRWSPSHCRCS